MARSSLFLFLIISSIIMATLAQIEVLPDTTETSPGEQGKFLLKFTGVKGYHQNTFFLPATAKLSIWRGYTKGWKNYLFVDHHLQDIKLAPIDQYGSTIGQNIHKSTTWLAAKANKGSLKFGNGKEENGEIRWEKIQKANAVSSDYGDIEQYSDYGEDYYHDGVDGYENRESSWAQGYSAGYSAAMMRLARMTKAQKRYRW